MATSNETFGNARWLADEPIVRLILDGTVVRVLLDRKPTSLSLLVGLGVRADNQKVLLAIRAWAREHWPGEPSSMISSSAGCGARVPCVDGAPGFESPIWQRQDS